MIIYLTFGKCKEFDISIHYAPCQQRNKHKSVWTQGVFTSHTSPWWDQREDIYSMRLWGIHAATPSRAGEPFSSYSPSLLPHFPYMTALLTALPSPLSQLLTCLSCKYSCPLLRSSPGVQMPSRNTVFAGTSEACTVLWSQFAHSKFPCH